jgi:type IV pilus assembly protein PilW
MTCQIRLGQKGFTLIELLIAMAIALLLMTGIYTTYQSQQKAYIVQDQMAQMQQNLRAAMYFLESDLRMAGYEGNTGLSLGVTTAAADNIEFSLLGDNECNPDENGNPVRIAYDIYDSATYGGVTLGRKCAGANREPVAPFIEILDFTYLKADGAEYNPGAGDTLDDIRSVEVTMVARASKEDRDYTNNNNYINAQGDTILAGPGDNFRRLALTKRVRCRNLGL